MRLQQHLLRSGPLSVLGDILLGRANGIARGSEVTLVSKNRTVNVDWLGSSLVPTHLVECSDLVRSECANDGMEHAAIVEKEEVLLAPARDKLVSASR